MFCRGICGSQLLIHEMIAVNSDEFEVGPSWSAEARVATEGKASGCKG
jgi:hypothetical protein